MTDEALFCAMESAMAGESRYRWSDERRAAFSQSCKARWSDPERRERALGDREKRRLQCLNAARSNAAKYAISSRKRFDEKWIPEPNSGCWLWQGAVGSLNGRELRGTYRLNGKKTYAPVVSWIFHRSPIPPGLLVCHRCDNPICVNPEHLFLDTYQGNTLDSVRKGRWAATHQRGNSHYNAKISESDVIAIRGCSEPNKIVAARLGISRSTVNKIRLRKAWRHVP